MVSEWEMAVFGQSTKRRKLYKYRALILCCGAFCGSWEKDTCGGMTQGRIKKRQKSSLTIFRMVMFMILNNLQMALIIVPATRQ